MAEKNVFEYTDVKPQNIVFSNFVKINNGENIASKIWYKENENSRPQTLNIQTPFLKVQKVLGNELFLFPDKVLSFMDSLDRTSLNFVQSDVNIQKYILGKLDFDTIIKELSGIDILKIEIVEGKRPTVLYSQRNKCKIDDKRILSNCEKVKFIFELDGIIIDVKNKMIRNNIIVRDILVSEIEPKLIELTEYSFVGEEEESENEGRPHSIHHQKQIVDSDSESESDSSDKLVLNSDDGSINSKLDMMKRFIYNSQQQKGSGSVDSASDTTNSSSSSEKPVVKRNQKPKPKPKPKQKKSRRQS